MDLETSGGASAPPNFMRVADWPNYFNPNQTDECMENLRRNLPLGIPQWMPSSEVRQGKGIIVGGGPSLAGELETLRALIEPGDRIIALNDATNYLIENGIQPWGTVFLEVAAWHPDFMAKPKPGIKYLLASICHYSTFERLKGADIEMWHPKLDWDEAEDLIASYYPRAPMVWGGHTAGLRAISLLMAMGYLDIHLFGMDSCVGVDGDFDGDETTVKTHAYGNRPDGPGHFILEIWSGGRKFYGYGRMAKQAEDFRRFCEVWHEDIPQLKIKTYGDGLLQHMHRTRWFRFYFDEMKEFKDGEHQ